MKKEQYAALHAFVEAHASLKRLVIFAAKVLPLVVYVSYPLLLVYLLVRAPGDLLRGILVPAVGFCTVTVLRKAINAPRPYECLGIPAISPKDTVGKSFPSRHAACVGVIAVTTLYEVPAWGVALLVIGVLIAASRVLAGVHFLRDVVCGLLLGGIIGYVGMYLIP